MSLLDIMAIYSSAFLCHYNSPRFYYELKKEYRNPVSYAYLSA